MLRRQCFINSNHNCSFLSSSSSISLMHCYHHQARFASTNNNNSNKTTTSGNKKNGDIFFLSQNGNYFFTDIGYSCIRTIKNTLITVLPKGKTGKGNSKKLSSTSYADMKIAEEARNLHNYKPQDFLEALSKGKLRSYFFPPTKNNVITASPEKIATSTIDKDDSDASAPTSNNNSNPSSSASSFKNYDEINQPPLPSSFARRKWWYAMMPTGYPHSVSQGFARFFLLNLIGASLAAFSLTLATQALLTSFFSHGTSVGWLLKDILPAFLTAYLAHTFINVETHPREWFIVANVITQSAVGFDFMIPFLAENSAGFVATYVDKQTVLVGLATISSFAKGLAMLILTTSRTALVQSFSREGNLVELSKRLHGMIIFIYPTASGVALAVAALIGTQAHMTIASLVTLASLGVISVSVMMVRNLYPRLLNVENAMESCRRYLVGSPVVKAAEAPSVALFARRVYRVPFRVGFDLDQAIVRAKKYKEAIAVVSFNDEKDQFHKAKYLFVFRRPATSELTADEKEKQQREQTQYYTMAQIQQLQAENKMKENDIVNPRKFVGILFDVHASFSDVMEGLLAAIMFREHATLQEMQNESQSNHLFVATSSHDQHLQIESSKQQNTEKHVAGNLSNEYCHADLTDAFPLSRKKGNEILAKMRAVQHSTGSTSSTDDNNNNNNNDQPPAPRVFLKKPKQSDVTALIQQLSQAGWQVRPHQIDNRDYRIEIQPLIQQREKSQEKIMFGDLLDDNSEQEGDGTNMNDRNDEKGDNNSRASSYKKSSSQMPSDAIPMSRRARRSNPNSNARILKNAMDQIMARLQSEKSLSSSSTVRRRRTTAAVKKKKAAAAAVAKKK